MSTSHHPEPTPSSPPLAAGHGPNDERQRWPAGWSRPRPDHIPRPTYWPAVMAAGITALFWGAVTSPIVAIVGAVLFILALGGWIGALSHGE